MILSIKCYKLKTRYFDLICAVWQYIPISTTFERFMDHKFSASNHIPHVT